MPSFYEIFSGAGLAREGLGQRFECTLAVDFDPLKAEAYAANFGRDVLKVVDVADLPAADLPGHPDLVWLSPPCQDVSEAGGRAGINGARSGAVWPALRLVAALAAEGRPPAIVAIENVCGFLTAGFPAIADALVCTGYRVGAIMADAALWAPQSRPRIFVVAVHRSCPIPPALRSDRPCLPWHPPALLKAVAGLSAKGCDASQWWRLPDPPPRVTSLADIIEGNAPDTPWHSRAETAALVRLMSPTNFAKIEAAQRVGCRVVMAGFRRMRGSAGQRTQRFEARDDGLAGALRMPTGGSSRQILLVIEGAHVRSRLMSGREAMRLMGAPDTYRLPPNLNDALALAGDAVAVPVVAFLRQHLFEPLLAEDPASIAEEKPAHA